MCRPELIHADWNRRLELYMQTRIDTCRPEPIHADWNCRLELYKIQMGTIQAHQNHIKQTGTDSSVRVHGCRCGFVCGLGGSDHSNKLFFQVMQEGIMQCLYMDNYMSQYHRLPPYMMLDY